jgi:hypothetical protein
MISSIIERQCAELDRLDLLSTQSIAGRECAISIAQCTYGFGNHLDSILDARVPSHLDSILDSPISNLAKIIARFDIRASKIEPTIIGT